MSVRRKRQRRRMRATEVFRYETKPAGKVGQPRKRSPAAKKAARGK